MDSRGSHRGSRTQRVENPVRDRTPRRSQCLKREAGYGRFGRERPRARGRTESCDVAASLGLGGSIEWGPGRHGLGTEQFLYLRDPDGHRIELLSHPYQLIDLEDEAYGWSTSSPDISHLWGPKPPASWKDDATVFASVPTCEPTDIAHTKAASSQVTT